MGNVALEVKMFLTITEMVLGVFKMVHTEWVNQGEDLLFDSIFWRKSYEVKNVDESGYSGIVWEDGIQIGTFTAQEV